MATCAAEHEKCLIHHDMYSGLETKLPTRVLNISSDPATGHNIKVRLVETHYSRGLYACFSYCWGPDAQESMTATLNFDQCLESIPLQNLPGTISDAIKLCRKLGFRYLWVDLLCIIQNLEQDWHRESSRMAAVYSQSALTVAIHPVERASKSFLQKLLQPTPEYESLVTNAVRLTYTDKPTGGERVMHLWREQSRETVGFLTGGWVNGQLRDARGRSSWLNRAWTLQ